MSALLTLNKDQQTIDVFKEDLNLPLNGTWTCDLIINDLTNSIVPGDNVTINISQDNSLSFVGTVSEERAGSFLNSLYCRVVGGKNGMTNIAAPKQFKNANVNDVITYLAKQAGE